MTTADPELEETSGAISLKDMTDRPPAVPDKSDMSFEEEEEVSLLEMDGPSQHEEEMVDDQVVIDGEEKEEPEDTVEEPSSMALAPIEEKPVEQEAAEEIMEKVVEPEQEEISEPVEPEDVNEDMVIVGEKQEEAMVKRKQEDVAEDISSKLNTSLNLAPSARTAADGPVMPIAAISAPVRATNPVLDELLYSLNLMMEDDPSLTQLDLHDCPVFTVSHGTSLALALSKNTHLKSLNLSNCGIQTQNAVEISEALKKNSCLEILILDNNAIQPQGMRELGRMLESNSSLKELRLAHQRSPSGTEAEQAFATAMMKNQTLTKLSLQIRDVPSRNTVDRAITRNKDIERKERLASASNNA